MTVHHGILRNLLSFPKLCYRTAEKIFIVNEVKLDPVILHLHNAYIAVLAEICLHETGMERKMEYVTHFYMDLGFKNCYVGIM